MCRGIVVLIPMHITLLKAVIIIKEFDQSAQPNNVFAFCTGFLMASLFTVDVLLSFSNMLHWLPTS